MPAVPTSPNWRTLGGDANDGPSHSHATVNDMNDLERYFYGNTGRLIHKWKHYFEIYDRHFARFRSKPVVVVEIGVYEGGSLQMWKNYFGTQAQIYGIDVDPRCKSFEEPQITIAIGSQEDRQFLRTFAQSVPRIDILIAA